MRTLTHLPTEKRTYFSCCMSYLDRVFYQSAQSMTAVPDNEIDLIIDSDNWILSNKNP
ncbi:MAG: hypothetical protein IPL33_07365 [Sphingobacteriales bacterium]|nr:hypothetical protein [Sphingobacteriales bacterium]